MKENVEEKTFINALTPSISILYKMYVVFFIIVPLSCLFGYFQVLKIEKFQITAPVLFLTPLFLFALLIFSAVFILFRNFVPHKVVVNNKGIHYSSAFRKAHMRWDQIETVKITRSIMGRGMFKLISREEVFNIPNTMKEINATYPKLSIVKDKWIYDDGTERQTIPENCPLFIEIQKYLKGYSINILGN